MANESNNATTTTENTTGAGETIVKIVDGVCVVTTADATENLIAPIIIDKPAANEVIQIETVPGQKYVFDFNENNVESFVQDGDNLTLTFLDGSAVVLENFGTASAGALPAILAFSNSLSAEELQNLVKVVDTTPDETELEEPQGEIREEASSGEETQGEDGTQVAAVEPAAGDQPSAQDLASIEPAAGEEGGAENSGFSFDDPDITPVGPLAAVGPIDPTALQYGVEFQNDTLFPEEEEPDTSPEVDADTKAIDETFLGPLSVGGNLFADFGSDGPGTLGPNGAFTEGGSLAGGALTSGAQAVTVTPTVDGYVGTINGGATTVFTLTIDPQTGDYIFTQLEPLDHADATDPNDQIELVFGINATDNDGDTASTTITILVADDAPLVSPPDANTINEKNLGPIVINDALVVDFGNDVAGSVTPEGTSNVTGVATLSSNGEAITITPTATGYIGTLAGGGTAFELVINSATGAYTFTQNVALDHAPGVDTISLDFAVDVTDFDGDQTQTTITVNIIDSVPVINVKPKLGDGLEVVDETDLPGVTVNGALTVDFGGDTPGAVTANDTFSSSGSKLGGNLTSNGVPVDVNLVGDTYVGTAGPDTIFTLQINPNGSYTFNLIGTLDHADPNDPNDIINLEFGATATDADGDEAATTIIVKVLDDVPTIGDSRGDVDESNLDGGPLSTSDTLFTSFGTELSSITPGGSATAEVGGNPFALTSGGQVVTFTQTANGYVGTINGGVDTVFTLTIDPVTAKYVYTQFSPFDHPDATDANDTIELLFNVAIENNDGDTDTGVITISVADDGPIANDDVTGAEEGQSVTGSVVANDEFSEDTPNAVTEVEFGGNTFVIPNGGFVNVPTGLGTLTLNSDGTYSFTATNVGNPNGTAVFTYTLTGFDGDEDTATLSVRVTPDGEPVAVTDTNTVDETNLTPGPLVINETLNVDFGQDGPGGVAVNGSFSASESLDNGTLTSGGTAVDVQQTANGYVGVLQGTNIKVFELVVQDNGDYSFELFDTLDHADATDPNDLIKLDFGVTVTDSDGDTVDGTITINVLDDAPVAFDDFNTVPQNQTVANGNVVNNDLLGEDAISTVTSITFNGNTLAVNGPTVIAGDYGVLTINSDGTYQYVSNGTNTVAVKDVFTYALTDFDGDTDTAELTIDVKDVDDKPILADPDPLMVDETDLNPTDTDSDTITANFGNDTPGTFTVTGAGTFSFTGAAGGNLTSDGVPVTVDVVGNSYVGSAGGNTIFTLTLNETTGEYEFTLSGVLDHADTTDPDDIIELNFGVTANDSDDDTDTGTIVVQVKDDGPVAHDDCNEFDVQAVNKDFNVVLVLDVSGSMQGNKIDLLKAAVANLLQDFNDYNGGEIKIHIVPFSANAQTGQTFTVTSDTDFADALAFLNGLTAGGTTNYEAPLESAIEWLQGASNDDPINGADTFTYFVSDGAPNRYLNVNDQVTSGSADVVMGEITGTDGSNEVATLQGLSKEVISVGIGVNATTLGRLGVIDSDGNALNVQDPNDLDAALQGTNPLAGTATGNVITGENGGPNAADDLSKDLDNTVTKVSFNGFEVVVDPVTGATIDGDHGTLEIFADGSYTYTVTDATITGDIVEQFVYTLVDGDGDPSTATLTLKGNAPVDLETEALVVDETDLNPTDTDSGVVTANFEPGVTVDYDANGGFTSSVPLTSNGTAVNVNVVGNDYVGTAGGSTIFTLVLNETTGAYEFTLVGVLDHPDATNPDDSIVLNFGVTATASDGDSDSDSIKVTVKDDGPVAVDDSNTVAQNTTTVNGNVTANDDGGEDVVATVTNVNFNGTDFAVVNGVPTVVAGQHGTLTISSNGAYQYVANGGNTTTVQDQFTYTLTDFDGDTDTAKLTISVRDIDSKPEVVGSEVTVDETDLNPTDDASNSVTANFGADGPGTITPTGAGSVTFTGAENNQLTSNGVPVTISVVGNDYVGTAGGNTIFTLDLNQTTGQYTFTLIGTLDHADETNPDDVIQLKFGVTATDTDGDTDTGTITVNVKDDGPFISSKARPIDEDGLVNGPISYSHTLNHDYGEDGAGEIRPTDNFMATFQVGGQAQTLTSGGDVISVTETANGYVGTAGGSTIFTLVVQNNGQYTYTQFKPVDHPDGSNPDDVIWLKFGVEIVDYDGDTDQATIIVDLHDGGPVAHDDCFDVEDEAIVGNVLDNDAIGPDVSGFVKNVTINGQTTQIAEGQSVVVDGQFGTLEIASDGSYTYTPKLGAQGIDSFTYTMRDFDGDMDSAALKFDVDNDIDSKPEAVDSEVTVDETDLNPTDDASNSVSADFGADGPGTITPTGVNTVTFTGAANNQLTSGGVPVTISVVGNDYVGTAGGNTVFTLDLNQATGQYTFTLIGTLDHADETDPDDVIKIKFGVTATDTDGDTVDATITVNVKDDGPVAFDDSFNVEGTPVIGNVLANDDIGEDLPGAVKDVTLNGQTTQIAEGQSVVVDGQFGTLEIASDGSYTYTPKAGAQGVDSFGYTMRDFDGDMDSAALKFDVDNEDDPVFIVGDNVDDVDGEQTPWVVGGGNEEIVGGSGGDILVGDVGGASLIDQNQDYNFIFVLDTSGSMGSNDPNDGQTSRVEIMIDAVQGLMNDFAAYQNGEIKVHLVSFSTNVKTTFTVDFSSPTALADVTAYLASQDGSGLTNYESPLQAANQWLDSGEPLNNAITTTYFISDGVPNRYVDDQGNVLNPPGSNAEEDAIILAEITGTSVTTSDGTFGDNTDEVGGLQAHGEVVAVGIAIPDNNNLNTIDSDGSATYIDDPNDLQAVLEGANPMNQLAPVGGDDIQGAEGDDLIFGDALNTDALADAQGLGTNDGAGWEVFAKLENGEGNDAGWTRGDTINYIRANAESLSAESVNAQGQGRDGGDDIIDGGAGNDTIFGQEGDDTITGGAGNDTIYGGSGADKFLFDAITDGVDTIKDFDTTEGDVLDVSALLQGYDVLQDSINDFVFATEVAGDTVIAVDETGSGNIANATQIAVLESVTGLDLEQATNNGETTV